MVILVSQVVDSCLEELVEEEAGSFHLVENFDLEVLLLLGNQNLEPDSY